MRVVRMIAECLRRSVVLAAFGAGVIAPRPASAQDTLALASFDSAWRIIYERHFDSTFNGVDWVALRAELRPRAAAAPSIVAVRPVIRDMLGRLRQSHFALIPREAVDGLSAPRTDGADNASEAGPGDLGMELRIAGDQFVISRLDSSGAAAHAHLRAGWVVRTVDGRSLAAVRAAVPADMGDRAAAIHATRLANVLLGGPAGTRVRLGLLDERDRPLDVEVARTPEAGAEVRFGNLPPQHARFESEMLRTTKGRAVGVLRFNVWMASISDPLARALDGMRGASGIVIDLRGNPGGVAGMVMGIGGHFLDEPKSLGTMKSRSSELHFAANPRRVGAAGQRVTPYDGPVVILIDELSASTSEVFASGMQAVGRARVIGSRSAGQALPAMMQRLPDGDVLYHAIADFVTPAGVRLEGLGVTPDEAVPLLRADLLAGRDAAMLAAERWIDGR